ncbi:MAG TPA: DUF5655 domain-containing protein [Candidatus Angelobacter sp.]|nr:DUF5655 domain-containing protein [Candidatus Angelobacter sp.]
MPSTKRQTAPSYDVHPSLAMLQSSLAGLKQKTGRTLDDWIKLVDREGPATEKERRAWLKAKHGLGMNYAWWIAERSVGKGDDGTPETYLKNANEYVQAMYSGAKEALLPIYHTLLALGRSLGNDVRVCPCQTMVPLYRNHVFAQIKPTTRTRIDLGLALKDTKVPRRLIDTGGLARKDRITHRIEIASIKDIDAEVTKWLKLAYDMDK